MAKALNFEDSKSYEEDETDVFKDLKKKEIEKFFARKLQAYLTGEAKTPANQSNQKNDSNTVDLEKELLSFLDDFEAFKSSDQKSVTSDDVSDSDSDSGSDETYDDDASVVIEEGSNISNQDMALIEMLTGQKREENEKVEGNKQFSLLDLGEEELNEELQKNHEFLLDFQSEVNEAEEKSSGKKNKVVKCYHCDGSFEVIGNYQKSLREHQKEKSHIEKAKERKKKNMSSAQSECSSVVNSANLPNYISTNKDNELCCDVCHGAVIGKDRKTILSHMQSEEHANNIQTRFEKPKKEGSKKANKEKPGEVEGDKVKKTVEKKEKKENKSKGEEKENAKAKKESKKSDTLAYALGLACIKPVSENQWECTMCEKTIPVAKEYGNLMRNISQHIQGDVHVKKLRELETSLKDIKEKPEVQKAKKKLKDNVYKFICLPCERDGYGYEFCKSHLASAAHKSKIYKIAELKIPANFANGVKCGGCLKYIFGANADINEHCTECIKKNGLNKNMRRNRRRMRREGKLQNDKAPRSGDSEGRGNARRQHDRRPNQAYRFENQEQNSQNDQAVRGGNNQGRGNARKQNDRRPNQAYRYENQEQNSPNDIAGQIANIVTEKVAEMFVNQPQRNQNQYGNPQNNHQFQSRQPRAPVASGMRDGFVQIDHHPSRAPPPAYQVNSPAYQVPPPAYRAPPKRNPPRQHQKKEKESCVIS